MDIFLLDDPFLSDGSATHGDPYALERYIAGCLNPIDAADEPTGLCPSEPPSKKVAKFKTATLRDLLALKDDLISHRYEERKVIREKEKSRVSFDVYCLEPSCYQQSQSIDAFFHALLTQAVWRRMDIAGKGTSEPGASLLALTNRKADSLFLINVNVKIRPFSARQHQEGVELLKHIRLTEELGDARNSHAMLYSFEPQLELLKRKPGNLILLSEGVTFFRLPEDLEKMANPDKLANLADKRAHVEWNDFKRFVQCDYQPPDSAHQFSNWWGLRQIALARGDLPSKPTVQIPDVIDSYLSQLENKKALLLFNNNVVSSCEEVIGLIDDFNMLINNIPKEQINIVYIDDESEWGNYAKEILSKDLQKYLQFSFRPPTQKILQNNNLLSMWVVDVILKIGGKNGPSLVLLDLRLLGDKEINVQVEKTSGAKIARIIRKAAPGLPIILMTASNKAYSFEAAMKLGIDGYWMKEGIGEHSPQSGSFKNYVELLRMISIGLGPEYQFLRLFSRKVKKLNDPDEKYWWQSYIWGNGDHTETDKNTLSMILNGVVILLREYLRLFTMGYGFKGEGDRIEQAWMCSLIVECAKPLELIHQLDLYRNNTTSFHILSNERGDEWAVNLNQIRNLAAHAQGGKIALKWEHARYFLSAVITWLITPFSEHKNNPIINTALCRELNGAEAPDFSSLVTRLRRFR